MRKLLSIFIAIMLIMGLALPASASPRGNSDWETAMNRSLDWIQQQISTGPVVGSVGGEWAVISLARAGRITADDPWLRSWFADLDRLLAEVERLSATHDIQQPPSAGTFPSALRRWTDFQRVTLALSSLGIDATNHRGHDLTAVYTAFVPPAQRHSLNRTINVDTFALIALDAKPYSGDSDRFIRQLLNDQRANGTWSLNPANPTSAFDIDITAMALQALAPYYYRNDPRVTNAVNNALRWLRAQTFHDVESTAQMIVALTALGPEFADEAEYYVNWLLQWFDTSTGAFRRPNINSPINLMATEQAAYALVAYRRFVNGMNSLYDMSDAFTSAGSAVSAPAQSVAATPVPVGLPNKHSDVVATEITSPDRTFADVQNHASRQAIEALAARGIIGGRTETSFAPNETMTRAEFAAIITRGLGLPQRNISAFDDVPSNAWFAQAVGTAFYYEIISGTSPTTFNPNGTITRQEAAVMVARAARLTGMNTNLSSAETLNILAMFGDYRTAADWAWASLAFCYREDILDDSNFYIQPQAAITRGEIAEMLYRLLDRANLM